MANPLGQDLTTDPNMSEWIDPLDWNPGQSQYFDPDDVADNLNVPSNVGPYPSAMEQLQNDAGNSANFPDPSSFPDGSDSGGSALSGFSEWLSKTFGIGDATKVLAGVAVALLAVIYLEHRK